MNIITNYEEALQAIYDHVGFKEDWVIYPINDCTNMFWKIIEEETKVQFANTKEKLLNEDRSDELYSNKIYHQRFYSKWIYVGELYTMIFVDTHTDGMRYFSIFTNSKRIE